MIDPSKILANLPVSLRVPLLTHYREIADRFTEHRWEPSELNGGKFCEAVYSIVEGAVTGRFASTPFKPKDMVQACRALETVPADAKRVGDRSLRVLIPRALLPLYEIRNNRGVGHVGGDVSPNLLDATAVYNSASWIIAELVRVFHGVSTEEAQAAVDALSERKIPLVWTIADMRRVQDAKMPPSDQALLLLHATAGWTSERQLSNWVGYSSVSMFRSRVLEPLHKLRLIEYERPKGRANISPLGSKKIEERLANLSRLAA